MSKIINTFVSMLRMILLLACFVLTFYIIINMYKRLEKNMIDALINFIPFFILFFLFSINFILKQKSVMQCTFYNITCCLVFVMILFTAYRTLCDDNMVAFIRLGYNINFNYFADMIAPIKAMLYILCVVDVLLIISGINSDNTGIDVLVNSINSGINNDNINTNNNDVSVNNNISDDSKSINDISDTIL